MAWFPVCKLINYGYCQGNVWAMCYNEHSETHQHTPTGCYSTCPLLLSLPQIPPFLLPLCLPLYLSLPCFYPFHLYSDFSATTHFFQGYFLISNTFFFHLKSMRRFSRIPRQKKRGEGGGRQVCSWLKKKKFHP